MQGEINCRLALFCVEFILAHGVSPQDPPKDVGLPEIPGRKVSVVKMPEESLAYKAFVREHVLKNPYIWILAISNFFMNTVRFASLDWCPTLLVESKGLTLAAATTLCFTFEVIGGNLGMLAVGWASDHVFGSRTHRTCVFCFAGIALAVVAFWVVPASAPLVAKLVPFALIDFFLRSAGPARHCLDSTGDPAHGGVDRRHSRLSFHHRERRRLRLDGPAVRLDFGLRDDVRLRGQRRRCCRPDVESPGGAGRWLSRKISFVVINKSRPYSIIERIQIRVRKAYCW